MIFTTESERVTQTVKDVKFDFKSWMKKKEIDLSLFILGLGKYESDWRIWERHFN